MSTSIAIKRCYRSLAMGPLRGPKWVTSVPKNFNAVEWLCFKKKTFGRLFYCFLLEASNIFCLYIDCLSLMHVQQILCLLKRSQLCGPMRIIFGSVIQSQYTSQNIKFGANLTYYVPKTPVYRFDLYGRYQILRTDEDNFCLCYLELVQKPKN